MQAYSMDLRVRVMADVDAGEMTMRAIAQKYRVSEDWIRKLKRMRRQDGSFAPRVRHKCHTSKLDEYLPQIEQFLREHPDATLDEIRRELNLPASRSTVDRAVKKLGFTFKKRRSMQRSNNAKMSSSSVIAGEANRRAGR